jgi:hypothetical protein
VLDQVARRTVSLRQSHPRVKAPSSIFEASIDDAGSIINYSESVMSATDFSFDDVVVNSIAYRRALANASSQNLTTQARKQRADSDADTVVGTEITTAKTSSDSKVSPQSRDVRRDWDWAQGKNNNEEQVKAVTETSTSPKISAQVRAFRRARALINEEYDKEEPVNAVTIPKEQIYPQFINKVAMPPREIFSLHTMQLANAFRKLTRVKTTDY